MRPRSPIAALLLAATLGAPSAAAADAPARRCVPAAHEGTLPTWARGGFSDPAPRMPYALARHGRIAAILFGDPLVSPPAERRANKILWVTHTPLNRATTLRISARRMVGAVAVGRTVTREVAGGPGPSLVDLPAAGCWRLSLRWAGRSDVVDLRYRSR